METIKSITVISKKNIGLQVLKDSLTSSEKKILVQMFNSGLTDGQVRNKSFHIINNIDSICDIVILSKVYSDILRCYETIQQKVTIKVK